MACLRDLILLQEIREYVLNDITLFKVIHVKPKCNPCY